MRRLKAQRTASALLKPALARQWRPFLPDQVVLRLIHAALARQRSPLPDFAVRVCVDELCHGMFERRPLPWLTMISCATFPSLPAVQWNTLKGRDPPLSAWDSALTAREAERPAAEAAWSCRAAKAVFRGTAAEPYSTNHRWTSNRTLVRLPIFRRKWREQGRLALVWHHCVRPTELDVYVHGLQGPKPAVGKLLRSESAEYNRCLTRLGAGKTAQDKALTLAEQASAVMRLSLLPAQPAPTADSSAAPPLSPAALRRAASVTSCTWRGLAVGPTG